MTLHSFNPGFRRQRGFSLIEVIAAFLIFALGFGVLLEILTGSLRIAHRSENYTQATLWAESLLDQVGVGEILEEGEESGSFNEDYRWSMVITQVDPPEAGMGVDGSETGDPAMQRRNGNDRNNRPLAGAQPLTATAAGVEQDTGIDLYEVRLTVYWGTRGHEQHTEFTTLRAVDAQQTKMRAFGQQSRRNAR